MQITYLKTLHNDLCRLLRFRHYIVQITYLKTLNCELCRLIKGTCTYVYPCPEQPSKKNCCQCCKAGQMSCKECHECECVHALKICNKGICPDPTQKSNGCYVVRSYPGYPKGCFFVSPCPSTGSDKCVPGKEYCNNCLLCKCGQPCPLPKCIDPKLDSCYLYNDKLGHCEFVSPCPQCCCEGEMTCRYVTLIIHKSLFCLTLFLPAIKVYTVKIFW